MFKDIKEMLKVLNNLIYIFLFSIYSLNFNIISTKNYLVAKQNNKDICLIYKCLAIQKDNNEEAWKCFHESAFDFRNLLNYAAEKKLPIILIIPESIDNISPLSDISPWIEGARVAISWASAYFRFAKLGKTDVRIIKVNENLDNSILNDLIINLFLLNIHDNKYQTPEEQISNRIFDANYIKSLDFDNSLKNNICIEEFNFEKAKNTKKIIISPKFIGSSKKRIFVSGAAGFLGSFIVTELLNNGHQVIGLDSLTCGSIENLKDVINDKNFEFHNIDITIPFEIEGHIDYVIHLASIPSPEFYYNLPYETLTSGLDGTKNCLELTLRKNARFLFSSTSEVYGDPLISPQPEEYPGNVNPFGKRSQYDESKRGAESLIKLYFDKYKLDIRIVRIFNTYGPNMSINDGRVVTNFCRAVLENKPFKIYGDGNQTRSFAFVSDTINGILKLLFNENLTNIPNIIDRVFNIGNDKEFTILELADKMSLISKELLKKDVSISFEKQIDPTDPKQRKPDLKRANKILNYFPKVELIDGLRKTLLYFYNKNKLNL